MPHPRLKPPPRRSGFPKPVIGIAGGIGAGKTRITQLFADLGCAVISSDHDAHEALGLPHVQDQLRAWYGPAIFTPAGQIDRKALAAQVFDRPTRLRNLNDLIHPEVRKIRNRQMAALAHRPEVPAVVWDTPLLFEVGLDRECDAVIFVKTPYAKRLQRVRAARGWTAAELKKREKNQIPLESKRKLADYVLDNSGEVTSALRQVREILSQILSRKSSAAQS